MLDKCNIDKKIHFIISDYSYLMFSGFTIGLLQGFLGIGSGVLFIPLLLEIGNSSYVIFHL